MPSINSGLPHGHGGMHRKSHFTDKSHTGSPGMGTATVRTGGEAEFFLTQILLTVL